MRFYFIFILNIFSVSGFKISLNLDPDPNDKLSQENGLDLKEKVVKRSYHLGLSQSEKLIDEEGPKKCDFPTKSGSNKVQDFPESFDVRNVWPSCISTITKSDGASHPSALLISVFQMSDLICTINGDRIDGQLTFDQMEKSFEDFKLSSVITSGCSAYQFWSENGIYSVDYQKTEICLPFSPQCKPSFITMDKYFKVDVTIPLNIPDKMKDMMSNGPAIALIEVYKDFLEYKSGIYEKRSDEKLGVYPFKIIGWGTEDCVDYWLGMNSWGENWGDKGTFKIRRSEENGILRNWLSVSLREQPVSNYELNNEQSFFLAHKEDGSRYENINGCLVVD
ncbi:cathepsin B [Tetranychus urticae]|uniref:Peptidase C1A papain C-terminal domain-containing protein n=1 Tax=Tetranychus urticae TaxID=32264 RepID=T1KW40_TETUR|nr:cathepsin B [Tetranychus urticae]